MNRKSLAIVAIITVIVLGAAMFAHRGQRPDSGVTASAGLLLPQLAEHLNDVTTIKLSGAGQNKIATFERGDKGWLLANRGNYPADDGKLRELVLKLSAAKTIEAKTSSRDLYPKLGVEETTAPNATGILVTLEGLPDATGVIVGNVNGGGGGTFVRRADQDQSWLIAGTLTVDRNTSDWIAKEIADIQSGRIRDVVIEKDGKSLHISKPAGSDGNFVIDNIPGGRKPTSEFAANGLAATLSGLRVDDVVPAAQMPTPIDAINARYTTVNGIVVDATAWIANDKHYAQFKARVDEAIAGEWIGLEQAKEDAAYQSANETNASPSVEGEGTATASQAKPLALSNPAKDRSEKLATIKTEVDRLNAAFDGWTFTLPAYKFENINKGMDDLLLPVDEKSTAPIKSKKK